MSALQALKLPPVISKAGRIISARWRRLKKRNSGNIRPAIKAAFQAPHFRRLSYCQPASASQRPPAGQVRPAGSAQGSQPAPPAMSASRADDCARQSRQDCTTKRQQCARNAAARSGKAGRKEGSKASASDARKASQRPPEGRPAGKVRQRQQSAPATAVSRQRSAVRQCRQRSARPASASQRPPEGRQPQAVRQGRKEGKAKPAGDVVFSFALLPKKTRAQK